MKLVEKVSHQFLKIFFFMRNFPLKTSSKLFFSCRTNFVAFFFPLLDQTKNIWLQKPETHCMSVLRKRTPRDFKFSAVEGEWFAATGWRAHSLDKNKDAAAFHSFHECSMISEFSHFSVLENQAKDARQLNPFSRPLQCHLPLHVKRESKQPEQNHTRAIGRNENSF